MKKERSRVLALLATILPLLTWACPRVVSGATYSLHNTSWRAEQGVASDHKDWYTTRTGFGLGESEWDIFKWQFNYTTSEMDLLGNQDLTPQ